MLNAIVDVSRDDINGIFSVNAYREMTLGQTRCHNNISRKIHNILQKRIANLKILY